jgi:brefeldin A-resistance guanine nucleotide exchange factor 1
LIPPFFSEDESKIALPPIPLQNPNQVIDRATKQNDSGFFSAFTSYISSYAADDPPEPSDEELESTLCTVDCVNACHMGDVFANISNLPEESLEALVEALLGEIPEDNGSGIVITVKSDTAPASPPPNGQKSRQAGPVYDPAMVYILELCTILALRDDGTIELLGKRVVDVLQAVLRDVTSYHPTLAARATFYLFKLLQAGYVRATLLGSDLSELATDQVIRTTTTSVYRCCFIAFRASPKTYCGKPQRRSSKV